MTIRLAPARVTCGRSIAGSSTGSGRRRRAIVARSRRRGRPTTIARGSACGPASSTPARGRPARARSRHRGRPRARRRRAGAARSDYAPPGLFDIGIALFGDRRGRGVGTVALSLVTAFLSTRSTPFVCLVDRRRQHRDAAIRREGGVHVRRGVAGVLGASGRAAARLRTVRAHTCRPSGRPVVEPRPFGRIIHRDGAEYHLASVATVLAKHTYAPPPDFGPPGSTTVTDGGAFCGRCCCSARRW